MCNAFDGEGSLICGQTQQKHEKVRYTVGETVRRCPQSDQMMSDERWEGGEEANEGKAGVGKRRDTE